MGKLLPEGTSGALYARGLLSATLLKLDTGKLVDRSNLNILHKYDHIQTEC